MTDSKGLEGLQVWQKAVSFAKRIYKDVIPLLPREEKWAMTNQLRRAVTSVAANIAEGYGRFYYQEGIRFCYIARGSLDETFTYVLLARDLGFIPESTFYELNNESLELKRLIHGYVAYLKKSKPGANEPGANPALRESSAVYPSNIESYDFES
jgi:four helix bundle protein